jgi:hypothetical protein
MRYQGRAPRTRGQILITTAVAMLLLIAIAALVVDLGMSWMLRRQEQDAADPAAVAAARWLIDSATGDPTWNQSMAEEDACFYAQQNGFFTDDSSCSSALGDDRLQVSAPPRSGPYAGRGGFVQVVISDTHPSFFGRLLGNEVATVTTGAVAANTAGNSNSNSLIALRPDGCDTGMIQGTGGGGAKVSIIPALDDGGLPYDGGYVYSNSECPAGVASALAACGGGSGSVKVSGSNSSLIAPRIYTVGTCAKNGSGATVQTNQSNLVNQGAVPIGDPLAGIPRPRLSDFPNGTCPDGSPSTPSSTAPCLLKGTGGSATCPNIGGQPTCILSPGVYYGGWDVGSKVRLQLQPGMYILAGGGIRLSGTDASIETVSNAAGTEPRVTIFSTDGPGCPSIATQCQGAVKFLASQDFRAKATSLASCQQIIANGGPNTCPWRGILLWQDGEGSNPAAPVSLGGQATTKLAGTIYAPKASVEIAGGSDTTGCTDDQSTVSCLSIQIIAWQWKITGNATVEMPYDPRELYQLDQRGLVH